MTELPTEANVRAKEAVKAAKIARARAELAAAQAQLEHWAGRVVQAERALAALEAQP